MNFSHDEEPLSPDESGSNGGESKQPENGSDGTAPRRRRIIVDEAFPQTEEPENRTSESITRIIEGGGDSDKFNLEDAQLSSLRRHPWRERTRPGRKSKSSQSSVFQPLTEILRKEDFQQVRTNVRKKKTSGRSEKIILSVENLTVGFGELPVLRDISFELRKGETLAVIGESGCGKTVLLKTLIGLLPANEGTVLFDETEWIGLSEKELAHQRTRLGFVFQQAALFDSMTIRENIAFPLTQHTKMKEREIDAIVVALLAEVGLSPSVLEKKPAEISGGMRKRVGFARALSMNPELMLYDEPTTGLDPIMSDVINELIIGTRDNHHVTGIMVTHDMKSAQKVADRIIMLYPVTRLYPGESQVLYDGPADEIEYCEDPRVAQFIRGEAGERLMEMRDTDVTFSDSLLKSQIITNDSETTKEVSEPEPVIEEPRKLEEEIPAPEPEPVEEPSPPDPVDEVFEQAEDVCEQLEMPPEPQTTEVFEPSQEPEKPEPPERDIIEREPYDNDPYYRTAYDSYYKPAYPGDEG